MSAAPGQPAIAVVIPCYKVTRHVLGVIAAIGPLCTRIYAVDDACPDNSGDFIVSQCQDPRVRVLRHERNQGVGGAMITGYRAALADHMDVVVKIDGDGQMNPALLPDFVAPILAGDADYTKGNRFFDLEEIYAMPRSRLIGNALLSFLTKLSSGYWDLFDPANGYTAIHCAVLRRLSFEKISKSYFFETDMLFRLNILRAVVVDVPMHARYGNEVSNLKISRIATEFLFKHIRNFLKRIFYNYYLRDMSLASIELPLGLGLSLFGLVFGGLRWMDSARSGMPASVGTVMLAALSVLMGMQLVLAFLAHDIASTPRRVLHRRHRPIPPIQEDGA
jgi:dolichol-phosphate mannosyltransferase